MSRTWQQQGYAFGWTLARWAEHMAANDKGIHPAWWPMHEHAYRCFGLPSRGLHLFCSAAPVLSSTFKAQVHGVASCKPASKGGTHILCGIGQDCEQAVKI